jgi:hypothetical protein
MNLSYALLHSQSPKLEDMKYLNCSECALDCSALNAREIERILQQFGPKIQTLAIKLLTNSLLNEPSVLIDCLAENIPNLKTLLFDKESFLYEWTTKPKDTSKFPNLENIILLDDFKDIDQGVTTTSLTYWLLTEEAAPNLKCIENFWLKNPAPTFWSEKSNLVKTCTLSRFCRLNDIEKFVAATPRLSRINIRGCYSWRIGRYSVLFIQLLNSCSDVLEKLEYLPWMDLRIHRVINEGGLVFLRLKTLVLKINSSINIDYYFNDEFLLQHPNGSELQSQVPSLKMVIFHVSNKGFGILPQIYPLPNDFSNFIGSVQEIEMRGFQNCFLHSKVDWEILGCPSWFKRMQDLFPNVKSLRLADTSKLSIMLSDFLQLWPKLSCLRLDVLHAEQKCQNKMGDQLKTQYSCENLDSVLTGMTPNILKKLETSTRTFTVDKINSLRTSWCLSNMAGETKFVKSILIKQRYEIR